MLRFVLLVCLFATPAAAETIDGSRIIVLDGDTVALPCVVPARGCAGKIRLLDIDALGLLFWQLQIRPRVIQG